MKRFIAINIHHAKSIYIVHLHACFFSLKCSWNTCLTTFVNFFLFQASSSFTFFFSISRAIVFTHFVSQTRGLVTRRTLNSTLQKCNIRCRYCIYHVKFTSHCKLIEYSRPIRFFVASLMYDSQQ